MRWSNQVHLSRVQYSATPGAGCLRASGNNGLGSHLTKDERSATCRTDRYLPGWNAWYQHMEVSHSITVWLSYIATLYYIQQVETVVNMEKITFRDVMSKVRRHTTPSEIIWQPWKDLVSSSRVSIVPLWKGLKSWSGANIRPPWKGLMCWSGANIRPPWKDLVSSSRVSIVPLWKGPYMSWSGANIHPPWKGLWSSSCVSIVPPQKSLLSSSHASI